MNKLRIINIKTREEWTEENTNHSWTKFCLDLLKNHPDYCLVWCDIEGVVSLNGAWYILDECGRWEYIPSDEYKVEEINDILPNKSS